MRAEVDNPFPGINWVSSAEIPNDDLLYIPGILSIRIGSLVTIRDHEYKFRRVPVIGEDLNNSCIRYGSCPGDTDWQILSEDGVIFDPLNAQKINGLVSVTQEVLELKLQKISSAKQALINLAQLYDIFSTTTPNEENANIIAQMFKRMKMEDLPGQLKRGVEYLMDQKIREIWIGMTNPADRYSPQDLLVKDLAS